MDNLQILYRIETTLRERGIPKADFYRDCHISSSAVSQWRNGKTKPSLLTLQTVADYIGVPFDALVAGTEYAHEKTPDQKEKAPTVLGESFTVDEIIEAYEMAPARVKAAIRSLLGL